MGFEIAEQLGWRCPDVLLYPTGGGVGIIAIYKALLELRELGWIDGDLPRLVAVQAEGCAPIVDAFAAGLDESTRAGRSAHGRVRHHGAEGARRLPRARRGALDRRHRRSRSATTRCSRRSARSRADEGTWVCPEGAACFAAVGAVARVGLARRHGRGRRAQHRQRPALPRHDHRRRPDTCARRVGSPT